MKFCDSILWIQALLGIELTQALIILIDNWSYSWALTGAG